MEQNTTAYLILRAEGDGRRLLMIGREEVPCRSGPQTALAQYVSGAPGDVDGDYVVVREDAWTVEPVSTATKRVVKIGDRELDAELTVSTPEGAAA